MNSMLTYERLSSDLSSGLGLIKNLFPIEIQQDDDEMRQLLTKISTAISQEQLLLFLIRRFDSPFAIAWLDVIDETAQLRIHMAKNETNINIEKDILLLLKEELFALDLCSSITGFIMLSPGDDSSSTITSLNQNGIEAQIREDLELILQKALIKKDTPVRGKVKLKSWKNKYLDEVLDLDFLAYQNTIDAKILPELRTKDQHKKFFVKILHGELGPLMKKACKILFVDDNIAGLVLATKLTRITGLIPTISILPDFQKRGYGTYLLNEAIQGVRKSRYPRILTSITVGNKGAEKLMRKFGFNTFQSHIDYLILPGHKK
ncbi:MAG: GNAT family N-acetyltransferase [Candidatus Ranarchaeia archaeon]